MSIPAAFAWPTNAHLIEDVAALGYLRKEWKVLDPTYGEGVFWKRWRPLDLFCCDLDPAKSPDYPSGCDFRNLPFPEGSFEAVVLDPPYKLNGTSHEAGDARYGVHVKASWQDRHRLVRDGITDCARVLKPGGYLLLKCQDQVCSGAIRWQTDEFTDHAFGESLRKVDRFDVLGTSRPQPAGRKQVHAHGRPSTLLVFRKPS